MTATLTLSAITRNGGSCDCCGRTLTKGYVLSDDRTLGRRCASKALGWPANRVEREHQRLARLHARDERRRAEGWTVEDFERQCIDSLLPPWFPDRRAQAEYCYNALWGLPQTYQSGTW